MYNWAQKFMGQGLHNKYVLALSSWHGTFILVDHIRLCRSQRQIEICEFKALCRGFVNIAPHKLLWRTVLLRVYFLYIADDTF